MHFIGAKPPQVALALSISRERLGVSGRNGLLNTVKEEVRYRFVCG